jgi:alkylhydroperoxidase family enzyme
VLLGRAAGLSEEKLAHLRDDPLPDGVYGAEEAAIVTYARRATRMEAIDDTTYAALSAHFDTKQMIEICFTVGMSNMINRFHATFLTDLDPWAHEALGPACPLSYPDPPGQAGGGGTD